MTRIPTNVTFRSLPITTTVRISGRGNYGYRNHPVTGEAGTFHNGVDIPAPAGTPILAVADGQVIELVDNDICGVGVVLRHFTNEERPQEFRTKYCHMTAGSRTVQLGSDVRASNVIGKVGTTGRSTGPHLHFILEVRNGTGFTPTNPTTIIQSTDRRVRVTYPPPPSRTNTTPVGTDITPYIATLESFHPYIQYELTRRRVAEETANTYMPFVRLTSLTKVYGKDLRGGAENDNSFPAYCPTLGIDGQPEVSFDDIYNSKDGKSIVGYATSTENSNIRIPLVASGSVADATSVIDAPNIPMPGITSITTDRSTTGPMGVRGGLFKATINIKAYSVGQLNTLLKYFIRPANRVVLELGRTSSSHYEQNLTIGNTLAGQTLFQKFNWKRPINEINDELEAIVRAKIGQREFIKKYIYNNFGDYEIFIGYVVNFKIKYTKDNIYDIELLVHSVQQFEISTRNTGVQTTGNTPVPNECNTIEIDDYFNLNSYWRKNSFISLLRKISGDATHRYHKHVVPLAGQGADPGSGGVKSTGFLITWEFFVNMVLRDKDYGIMSLFQQPDSTNSGLDLLYASLLAPVGQSTGGRTDLNANEVAWNAKLRSIDPNTMIIYNRAAQEGVTLGLGDMLTYSARAESLLGISKDERQKLDEALRTADTRNKITTESPIGSFDETTTGSGVSDLTKGIWINSNAVVDAFTSTDTISMAITRLLNAMNAAVQGYWNLQPLSSEEMSGMYVIDAGLSKPIDTPVRVQDDILITGPNINLAEKLINFSKGGVLSADAKPEFMYVFNRRSQILSGENSISSTGDTLIVGQQVTGEVGSEVLDISVESSLPQVVAVQAIAGVGGVGNAGTLAAIDIEELKKITLYDTYVTSSQTSGICTDPDRPRAVTTIDQLGISVSLPRNIANEIIGSLLQPRATVGADGDVNTYIENQKKLAYEEWEKKWKEENTPPDTRNAVQKFLVAGPQGGPDAVSEVPDVPTNLKTTRETVIREEIDSIRQAVTELVEANRPGVLGLVSKYGGVFGMAIDLVEYDVTRMAKNLQVGKEETEVHPFNSSNLTKTIVNLTLPGVGGIQLWQSFMVERIPNILERGFYVVTKVAHEFAVDKGWITQIQGRFRYKPQKPTR